MILLPAPSQPFFHNLILMNLGFDILEYGHYVSSYMVLKEMKSYTLHQLGTFSIRTVAKQITCIQ